MAAVLRNSVTSFAVRLMAVALLVATAMPAHCADARRPLLLLYETSKGEGVDKELAEATTKAIRGYFRETQKVDVAIFDRDSPTVVRAVMEKKLTPEKVANYASQAERLEVGSELGFHYAGGAEVSVKMVEVDAKASGAVSVKPAGTGEEGKSADKKDQPVARQMLSVLEVKLWVGRTSGGKADRWEAIGSASANGAGERDLDNAMQSAASFAVNDISRRAFADLPRVTEKGAETGAESTAIGADQPPAVAQPTASDYAARAEDSLKSGNIALAIQQYTRAVNAEPTNGALRAKLAEAYAAKGMYDEAEDVLKRAESMGVDSAVVEAARKRIEDAKNGAKPTQATPEEPKPAPREDKPVNGGSTSAIARLVQGDKLWSEGKPDEAAAAYAESIKLNPADWRAYERLAVVDASMSLFGESRKVLEQLEKVQPDPPKRVAENRYNMLRKSFDARFMDLLKQYQTNGADFEKSIITRESYYNTVRGLAVRLESMASFLDALKPSASAQPAHLHRSVACGLAAQAAASLLDYLETNNEKAKSNASVFAAQAKAEMDTAAKLDGGGAAPQTPSTQASTQQPEPSAE